MSGKIAIIGGSGLYSLENAEIIKTHRVSTPFGEPSDEITEFKLNGVEFLFLPRHGKGHKLLPHELNYQANIYALKTLGAKYLVSISAVGSLKEECPPKSFVIPDQFIDWTKGIRKRTFLGNGIIGHISVAEPVDLKLKALISNCFEESDLQYSVDGSYVCIEGPQFSSKAESNIYRSFGAKVIGMTNVPEAYLAKEAGIAYSTIAMVTDYDCWKDEHCTVDEILEVMKENNSNMNNFVQKLIPYLNENKFEVDTGNAIGIMSPIDSLSEDNKQIVETLLS